MPAKDAATLNAKVSSLGATPGVYFDLSLFKRVADANDKVVSDSQITSSPAAVEFAVEVPAELRVSVPLWWEMARSGGSHSALRKEERRLGSCRHPHLNFPFVHLVGVA